MDYNGSKVSQSNSNMGQDTAFHLKYANIFYTVVFLVFSVLMFILQNTGHTWLGKIISTAFTGAREIGSQLTSRTSFALFLWFLIHAFVTTGNANLSDSCRFIFHVKFLTLHTLLLLGIWVATWFIPDELFTVWIEASRYISAIYIIVQLFFLIDFFYGLNNRFTEKESICVPLTITIILMVGSLAVLGVDYYLFGMSGCGMNVAFTSVAIVGILILFFGALIAERGSILMASLIAAYVAYLTTMSMFTGGSESCNRLGNKTSNVWLSIFASIFTLCWACYSAFSTTYMFKILDCGLDCCGCCEHEEDETLCGCCCDQKEDDAKEFSLAFFHIMFAGASSYMAMIVTCWGSSDNNSAPWSVDRGQTSMWVNIVASWLCMALYGWSLIAPYLFPDREFDD